MASILWVDEDFDKNIFVEVTNAAIPLAQNMGSWCGQAIAGAGGTSPISFLQIDNVLGHLGILRIPTGSTSGNSSFVFLARDSQLSPLASEAHVPLASFIKIEAWVRVPTITTVNCSIGLAQNFGSSTFGTDGFFFDFDPANSANWRCVTRAASTNTISDSGVPVVAGAWYKLTMRRMTAANEEHQDGHSLGVGLGSYRFYINDRSPPAVGSLVHHSTNLPTADMVLGAWVRTNTTGARNFDIDRVRVWLDEAAMVT